MRKEFFKSSLPTVLSLLLIFGQLLATSAFAALSRQPYLQSVSDNRVVLRWRTTTPASSRVSYGASVGNLNTHVDDSNSSTEHEVVISGLNANTQYFYSVGSITGPVEAGNDASHHFTTAPDVGSNQKIRVWAIGDPGTGTSNQRNVRNAYYNLDNIRTDVVLTLGDNAYSDGKDSEYTNNFFNVYNDLFRQTAVWATRGNHERNLSVHESAFTHPKNGESGGLASGSELYYSFDYGNIHFVCLDSFTSSNLNGTAMYDWLEADLASTTQKWIIAYWHHPPYSRSSSHDSNSEVGQKITREKANPILEQYGVDLQLGGHNHFYSRTFLINNHYGLSSTYNTATHAIDNGDGQSDGDGVYDKASNLEGAVYVLAGSSGKLGYTPIHHPANFTEVVQFGSMVIDVDSNRMDVRMLRENGAIQDYFSITKTAPTNQAPSVNAGLDMDADTGVAVNLDATVTDDGLPGGNLTYSWSKVSGPGTATFGNASSVDTTVSFSAAGSYVLGLEVSDSDLTSNDELTITVTDPNQAPSMDAGLDMDADTGVAVNLDATVTDDGLPGGNLTYSWSKVSGPGTATFGNASSEDTTVLFSAAGSYVLGLEVSDSDLTSNDELTITVTDPNQAPSMDAGLDMDADTGVAVNLDATVTDDGLPGGNLTYSWSKVSGPGTATFGNASSVDTTVSLSAAGSYVLRLEVSDSALSSSDEVTITVTDPNQAPLVNAGVDQQVETGVQLNLNGTIADDGLPNGTLVVSWSKISGPGNASFNNASAVDTSVSLSAAGSYVLRLEVSDSALSSSDEVTITVTDPNQEPLVNAGVDQQVETGVQLNLNGTIADDGLPNGTLEVSWSKISGPGNASFDNASAVDTSVSFSVAGIYQLQLEVNDSQLSTSDNLIITVINSMANTNQPPMVDAGSNQSVNTDDAVNLNTSVTDDGRPLGSSLSHSWSLLSGPGNATFGNANLPDTTVSFSSAGTYVLQLESSDSALTASDEITFIVTDRVIADNGQSGAIDIYLIIGFLMLSLVGRIAQYKIIKRRAMTWTQFLKLVFTRIEV